MRFTKAITSMHKHFVNEERKLVRNRGEVDAWYIEDDHEAIVSPELWQKAQDALAVKRDYLSEGSVIEEFTEENYPYMNKIYCAKCGYPFINAFTVRVTGSTGDAAGRSGMERVSVMASISRMVCFGVHGILKKILISMRKHQIRA